MFLLYILHIEEHIERHHILIVYMFYTIRQWFPLPNGLYHWPMVYTIGQLRPLANGLYRWPIEAIGQRIIPLANGIYHTPMR